MRSTWPYLLLAAVALVPTGIGAQQPVNNKDLLFAAIQIHSLHSAIKGFGSSCNEWGKESVQKIAEARSKWEHKNAAVLKRASEVMAQQGTTEQRARLDADLAAENKALEQKAAAAPPESRQHWCSEFPDRMLSAFMDPQSQNPMAFKILMQAQPNVSARGPRVRSCFLTCCSHSSTSTPLSISSGSERRSGCNPTC